MKNRIYVLYAPGGNGHKSNARTIKEAFKRRYTDCEVILEDVYDLGNSFLKFSLSIYDNLLKIDPKFVKYGYRLLNKIETDKNMVSMFPKVLERIKKRFREVQPDLIVSVHSAINNFLAEAISDLGWKNKVPFVIVCTDMTNNFLKTWGNENADLHITFLEEGKEQYIKYGLDESKIKVLGGLPVNPIFMDNQLSKEKARELFKLDKETFTVFIMSGGIGLGNIYKFTKQLVISNLPIQIIVCCGKNRELEKKVQKLANKSSKKIKVFGFTNQIHNIMDASDIIVTKPGPGVISEAIVKELPIILDNLSEIMPQESGNVEYVLKNGIGKIINELHKFHNIVANLIYNQEELLSMKENMKKIKSPDTCYKLADILYDIAVNKFSSKQLVKNIS
jgi:UDP-N-acetylglucosamine:LPS N-acetylglucosamine transferase